MVFKKIHKKHCPKHIHIDFPLILTDLNKHLRIINTFLDFGHPFTVSCGFSICPFLYKYSHRTSWVNC